MPVPSVDRVIPLGVGGVDEGYGGGPSPGGTGLVILAGLIQVLGFAIPVVIATAAKPSAEGTAEAGYALGWTYGQFTLHAPGLAEWAFYLPAAGVAAMLSALLPTRFLRPLVLVAIGAVPLVVLAAHPEHHARMLERLPLLGWTVGKASALKGLALLALALAGAVIGTYAPRAISIGAAVIAAGAAVLYLAVPLPAEFPGGFAWRPSLEELMAGRPPGTAWSDVAGRYVLLVAFGIDLLAIGLAALMCLLSFRGTWNRAGRWVGGCVAASLATAALVIAGRALRPVCDPTFEVGPFACELAFKLKMLLATLGIVLLLPVGLIDLIGRSFGRRL